MNGRRIVKRLLFPHPAVAAVCVLCAAAGLAYAFLRLDSRHPLSIASYVLSFYALGIMLLRVPKMMAAVQKFRRENRYYLRYASDVQLRMKLSLFGSFVCNAVYAAFQLALGIVHHAAWFYALAGYYALLAGMRLMLGRHIRAWEPCGKIRSEWRKYQLCGAGLLLMNLALAVLLVYFVRRLRPMRHHEITVIAMAAYAFGALALAIINLIRYRRYASPVCSAAKALSLAAAAVSMLSLENAMLSTFSTENQYLFQQIMLGASGAGVSLLILAMAFYMMMHASRKLKELSKGEKENE